MHKFIMQHPQLLYFSMRFSQLPHLSRRSKILQHSLGVLMMVFLVQPHLLTISMVLQQAQGSFFS
jgi:hypothetical protein